MKMTREQYKEAFDSDSGYCSDCDRLTATGTDPEAEENDCPECGNPSVMGIENALIYENVKISDDADEDFSIISFSDDDDYV